MALGATEFLVSEISQKLCFEGERQTNTHQAVTLLTLHEAAFEMHPERQGGLIKASLEAILTQIFHITWIWGQKFCLRNTILHSFSLMSR